MPTLKEFDLDIPYPNIDGTPEDYEANWREKEFNSEMRYAALLLFTNVILENIKTNHGRY
ncbi:hypothetical protein M4D81_32520 [Paenibacillus sp. p3-SID867]|uniref:hypothetical protein n=1 Tax=Paenibacillus sp. p3-SID867 TaxID=2916363 RepID=UPI0021A6BC06|nr:hypothetical protein [Paenibacillus sp. p3-SID867]MCT1403731.1 hypothetical protein [Paenibacillus sp. p3-SID867]